MQGKSSHQSASYISGNYLVYSGIRLVGNSRMGVQDVECLVRNLKQTKTKEKGAVLTAESTSYTRKPEFKFVSGVMDGPIQDVASAV